MMAGCGFSQPPVVGPATAPQTHAIAAYGDRTGSWTLKVLHRFSGTPDDGAGPTGSLTAIGDELYGATGEGGAKFGGTIFAISSSGKERVLFSFNHKRDGDLPLAGPIAAQNVLYGTTFHGGTAGQGTIFKLTTAGKERVLYGFKGLDGTHDPKTSGGDGSGPDASLVLRNGVLYGTTQDGGTPGSCCDEGCGTIFRLDLASGKESVIYRFQCGSDGEDPGDLIAAGDNFYGVTFDGGTNGCQESHGCGTIYEISASGRKRTLYTFTGGDDGAYPLKLVELHGSLYGITWEGGASACSNGTEIVGCGTIFEIAASGKERTLHSFNGRRGGEGPSDLIAMNGALYGTTSNGGTRNHGTIFGLNASGKESVLYSFKAPRGRTPISLFGLNGTLYGTTAGGGDRRCYTYHEVGPCGAVFSFTPK
jgi:uncharacterized repeat protein (TIGR03803 family)